MLFYEVLCLIVFIPMYFLLSRIKPTTYVVIFFSLFHAVDM